MVKAGVSSSLHGPDGAEVQGRRRSLIDAAIETLRQDGFNGASARAIAQRAGCNQSLIFYYFKSVVGLLLAALDDVSQRRLAQYTARMEAVHGPRDLVAAATDIFREDLDAGYVSVLTELIAGASSTPGLGPEVIRRIVPWTAFAERAMGGALGASPLAGLVPLPDLAYGAIAFYLGLEMLSHLEGDRTRAEALFQRAGDLAGLLETLTGWLGLDLGATTTGSTTGTTEPKEAP